MPSAASSLTEPGTWGWRKSRRRRPSAASPASTSNAEPRWPQRLFKRPSTSSLSVATSPPEDTPRRRSFLAKPPAPGSTRRVLAVLNPPPRNRRPSNARPPPSTAPPPTVSPSIVTPPCAPDPPSARPSLLAARAAVLASGYEDPLSSLSEHPSLHSSATLTVNTQTKHSPHAAPLHHCPTNNCLHSAHQPHTQHHQNHNQHHHTHDNDDDDDNNNNNNNEEQNVPDRPVSSFTDDMTDAIARHDSASSSVPLSTATSGPGPDNTATRFLEVDASEVSDEVVSSAEANLSNKCGAARVVRAAHAASALAENLINDSATSSNLQCDAIRATDKHMPTDSAPDICDVLGLSTTSATQDSSRAWRRMQDRVRELQHAIKTAQADKLALRLQLDVLTQQNENDNALISSLRLQSARAVAEADHATRQLKDSRRRLSRRIRDLEHQAAAIAAHHADELAHRRAVERRLRAELDDLRDAMGVASTSSRRRRADSGLADSLSRGSLDPCRSRPASCSNVDISRSRKARLEGTQVPNRAPSIPRPGTPSQNSGTATRTHVKTRATPTTSGKPGSSQVRQVIARTGGVSGETMSPAAALVTVAVTAAARDGGSERSPLLTHEKNVQEAPIFEERVCPSSPGTLAKRSLFRRAFIAHIQSSRYRSSQAVWLEFFGAKGEDVSLEQFARAIRSLAVAADASDEDLVLLRNEVCGNIGDGSGIVSWPMFSRFYEMTKNEST